MSMKDFYPDLYKCDISDGIVYKNVKKEIQYLEASYNARELPNVNVKEYIIQECFNTLLYNIIKSGQFQAQYYKDYFNDSIIGKVRLGVVNLDKYKFSHIEINEEGYRYNNKIYTEDEIKNALKNTYPENFI